MPTTSKRHFVGQLQKPHTGPEDIELIIQERADITTEETAAGIIWVDSRYNPGDYRRYGAADGIDSTVAIQNAVNSNGFVFGNPGETYIIDPDSPILFDSDTTFWHYGLTFQVKAGDYSFTTSALFRNSASVNFDSGEARESNSHFYGGTLDGNIANVTFSASGGISGIVFFQVDDCTVTDLIIFDMPGTNGNGYGIISRFSRNVNIINPSINRTDRQNIIFVETTGSVRDGRLKHSFFRDNIAVGGAVVNEFQFSYVVIDGVDCDNSMAIGGGSTAQRTIRFTAGSSGVIKNCPRIKSKTASGAYAIYLSSSDEQNVSIKDNHNIEGGEFTVLVEGTSKKNIRLGGNIHKNATNGFRFNALAADGVLDVDGDTFDDDITTRPFYVNSCDNVNVRNIDILGGDTACFMGTWKSLHAHDWNIEGMTDATRVLNISTPASGNEPAVVHGIVARGNTSDSINFGQNSFVTDVAATVTTSAGGIAFSRIGAGYLWRDTTGDLRISVTEPTSIDSDGVIVGTQS